MSTKTSSNAFKIFDSFLSGLPKYLAEQLDGDETQISEYMHKYFEECFAPKPSKTKVKEAPKPVAKKSKNVDSKALDILKKKIADAKAAEKYYCVTSDRKLGKNPKMLRQYDFYSDLGIAGVQGSQKLLDALKLLGKEDAEADEKKPSAAPKTIPKKKEEWLKFDKNEHGNYEDPESHIVFDIRRGVAIGVQDEDTGEVLPLEEKHIKICKKKKWEYQENTQDDVNESVLLIKDEDDEEEKPKKKKSKEKTQPKKKNVEEDTKPEKSKKKKNVEEDTKPEKSKKKKPIEEEKPKKEDKKSKKGKSKKEEESIEMYHTEEDIERKLEALISDED